MKSLELLTKINLLWKAKYQAQRKGIKSFFESSINFFFEWESEPGLYM